MSLVTALETNAQLRLKSAEDSANKRFSHMPGAIKTFVEAWPLQSTFTDSLRASGLYFVCPREFVLNYWQPSANRFFDLKSQLMMSIGTHLHEYLQNCVLGPMGVLRGEWVEYESPSGMRKHVLGYHPDPEKTLREITEQKPITWQYQEYRLFDKQHRISGHCDGVISIERIKWLSDNMKLFRADPPKAMKELQSIAPGDECLLEIKTAGAWPFKKVTSSVRIPDYNKMQAVIYQRLKSLDKTVFWYVNRDTCDSRVMVYPGENGWWVDATSKARVIWEAIRDERMPDTFAKCIMPQDKRAKECTFCKPCWDRGSDFAKYVDDGKIRAAKENRSLLDLSGIAFP